VHYLDTETSEPTNLPASNVLQFITKDGSIVSARPSGTEPKIKFYCSVNGELSSRTDYKTQAEKLDTKITVLLKDLGVS
jgi:phosphoglucomutase